MMKILEKRIENNHDEATIDLALDTIKQKRQALLFVNTKRSAEKVAEDIAHKRKIYDTIEEDLLSELSIEIESVLGSPTKQCLRLAKCVKKGIAFHHSGLHQKQRELIEDNFRAGNIKIIGCTPTLAAGLDMPAFRSIIRDLKRHGGNWGMVDIPVLEYHQMAGRAGRPGKDDYGEAICICKSNDESQNTFEKYINGENEKIYSKLAAEPVLRTYVLSLISSGYMNNEKSLVDFFSKTFWAHQYGDMQQLSTIIKNVLNILQDYGFIYYSTKVEKENHEDNKKYNKTFNKHNNETNKDYFSSALDFEASGQEVKNSKDKIRATRIGKRVAELYLDPYTANHLILGLKKAHGLLIEEKKEIPIESFLQLISHTIEMKPLLNVRKKNIDEVSDFLIEYEDLMFESEPSLYDIEYEDFQKSVNTALFFKAWVEEQDEESLLERFNIRPGETRYKLGSAEWLLYACIEFSKILGLKEIVRILNKLSVRVKYGVKEQLLPLLKFKNIGRVRARKLYDAGFVSVKEIRKIDVTSLSQIVGSKIAQSLKSQLGEEVNEVLKTKRKGQMSINKYSN